MESLPVACNKEFLEQIKHFKRDMHKKYMDISAEPTPQFDSTGQPIIKKRPDGYDYLEEVYMRTKLDKYFPGWSWEGTMTQFLSAEWVWVSGHLIIIDEYLLAFNIIPPIRKFYGLGAKRVTFGQNKPHIAENIIDIGNDLVGANSKALKFAINRLCRIGDDVYGKRFDEESAGSLEEVMTSSGGQSTATRDIFFKFIKDKRIASSRAMEIIEVKSWTEIHDWLEAYNKVKGFLEQ